MKRILNYFRQQKQPKTAVVAKERLQIIIAHERGRSRREDFLSTLQQELVLVVAKYLNLDAEKVREHVKFDLAYSDEHSVLELNIAIPEQELPKTEG